VDPNIIVNIQKHPIPIIYFDTCFLIEFSKCKQGRCTDSHKEEIEELYNLVTNLRLQKKLFCPLGNQQIEMSPNAKYLEDKKFILEFTDRELLSPYAIEMLELKEFYNAFIQQKNEIALNTELVFEKDIWPDSPFNIKVDFTCSPETLKKIHETKLARVQRLEELKNNGLCSTNFEAQLNCELNSYPICWYENLHLPQTSIDNVEKYMNAIKEYNQTTEDITPDHIETFWYFLWSEHHRAIPFRKIKSTLWAWRVTDKNRKNAIGDYQDTEWAAAYLPFVDYAITDRSFCSLLEKCNLPNIYGTKVYSIKTIKNLINDLSKLK